MIRCFGFSRRALRRSNAEFRHHLFQVTADSVFQPHLEIFQNLAQDQGAWCSRLHESGSVDVVTFATEAWWWWWWLWWCWWWPRSSTTYILLTSGLATLQGKHGKHASREKTLTQPSQSLFPHWTSTSLVVPGRTALRRWRVVAVPSVLTHCQMRRSVRTALWWPHSALWEPHREVGRWPRCAALAQIRPHLTTY